MSPAGCASAQSSEAHAVICRSDVICTVLRSVVGLRQQREASIRVGRDASIVEDCRWAGISERSCMGTMLDFLRSAVFTWCSCSMSGAQERYISMSSGADFTGRSSVKFTYPKNKCCIMYHQSSATSRRTGASKRVIPFHYFYRQTKRGVRPPPNALNCMRALRCSIIALFVSNTVILYLFYFYYSMRL